MRRASRQSTHKRDASMKLVLSWHCVDVWFVVFWYAPSARQWQLLTSVACRFIHEWLLLPCTICLYCMVEAWIFCFTSVNCFFVGKLVNCCKEKTFYAVSTKLIGRNLAFLRHWIEKRKPAQRIVIELKEGIASFSQKNLSSFLTHIMLSCIKCSMVMSERFMLLYFSHQYDHTKLYCVPLTEMNKAHIIPSILEEQTLEC